MPAGPAPTTRTSNCLVTLIIGADSHPRLAYDLTTTAMPLSVNLYPAFKTNSHPAQRPSGLIRDRLAARGSLKQDRYSHGRSVGQRHRSPIHHNADQVSQDSMSIRIRAERPNA